MLLSLSVIYHREKGEGGGGGGVWISGLEKEVVERQTDLTVLSKLAGSLKPLVQRGHLRVECIFSSDFLKNGSDPFTALMSLWGVGRWQVTHTRK